MMKQQKFMCAVAALGLLAGSLQATPSEHFKVFLCFGQSNMSGGTQVPPDDIAKTKHERVMALSFTNCSQVTPTRTENKWYEAFEPLHCDDNIRSMGPAYAFGQMLADSLSNDTIGLIPCGLWGVSIEMFMKGKTNKSSSAPPGWGSNAWDRMVTKCTTAMQRGVFTGIILEQGESNSGDGAAWLSKVKTVYKDLKTALPFEKDVPLVAGELLQASGNCCAGLNATIDKIHDTLPNGYFASSKDLAAGGDQKNYHFDQAGYRKLGQRMAVEMLKGLKTTPIIPQKTDRVVTTAAVTSWKDGGAIYSLDGKLLATGALKSNSLMGKKMQPGKIYVVAQKAGSANARLMIAQ